MTLYKDKYRIESTRLKDWDYSRDGYYFVTICTQDKKCFFGDVIDEKVRLSAIGEIAADEWQKTAQIRNNVSLDAWIIMPNHLHGIVIINNNNEPHVETHCDASNNENTHGVATCRDALHASKNRDAHGITAQGDACNASLQKGVSYDNKFGTQMNNLSSIIRGFKSATTKRIHRARYDFSWQSRFYDHIIRNERSLMKIREYIINNPLKWEIDKENPANLFM